MATDTRRKKYDLVFFHTNGKSVSNDQYNRRREHFFTDILFLRQSPVGQCLFGIPKQCLLRNSLNSKTTPRFGRRRKKKKRKEKRKKGKKI